MACPIQYSPLVSDGEPCFLGFTKQPSPPMHSSPPFHNFFCRRLPHILKHRVGGLSFADPNLQPFCRILRRGGQGRKGKPLCVCVYSVYGGIAEATLRTGESLSDWTEKKNFDALVAAMVATVGLLSIIRVHFEVLAVKTPTSPSPWIQGSWSRTTRPRRQRRRSPLPLPLPSAEVPSAGNSF